MKTHKLKLITKIWILSLLFIIPISLIIISDYNFANTLAKDGKLTDATIVKKSIEKSNLFVPSTYYIFIKFSAQNNVYEKEVKIPSILWYNLERNDLVSIKYSLKNPQKFMLAMDIKNKIGTPFYEIIFISVFLMYLLLNSYWIFCDYKKRKYNALISSGNALFLFLFMFFIIYGLLYSSINNEIVLAILNVKNIEYKYYVYLILLIILIFYILKLIFKFLQAANKALLKKKLLKNENSIKADIISVPNNKNNKKLSYKFYVKDKVYENKTLSLFMGDSIKAGENINIYYDPKNPNINIWEYE
jgi:hypothetical protein